MAGKLSEEREQRLEQLRNERLKLEELKEELHRQQKATLGCRSGLGMPGG